MAAREDPQTPVHRAMVETVEPESAQAIRPSPSILAELSKAVMQETAETQQEITRTRAETGGNGRHRNRDHAGKDR